MIVSNNANYNGFDIPTDMLYSLSRIFSTIDTTE